MKKDLKKRLRTWEAVAVVLATLLTLLGSGWTMAKSYETVINNALGVGGASVTRSDDDAFNYYPSDYTDTTALEAAYLAICEEAESEGIVLLKNENGALPLAADEKVSTFLTGSVKFNYSASGSSAADTSGYSSLRDALAAVIMWGLTWRRLRKTNK